MELAQVVPKMTKLYLHRTLESVLKDVRRPDEAAARELILKNRDALADRERIRRKLDFLDLSYDVRVVAELVLETLLNQQEYALTEDELIGAVDEALKQLQLRGLVLRYRDGDKTAYAVCEEVAAPLRTELGIELRGGAFRLLLGTLSNPMLQRALKHHGLSPYGSKDELIDRVLAARLRPSEVLQAVSNDELYGLLRRLPKAPVSGSKPTRIQNLIAYYDQLVRRETRA